MNKLKMMALVIVTAVLGSSATASAAALPHQPGPQYHYVGLDAALPAGFDFFVPAAINDRRSVYGTAYRCLAACLPTVLVYRKGTMRVVHEGLAYSANNQGTVGGSVLTDPDTFREQAALFADDGAVVLIPRPPGESTSHVRKVTNSGIALVESVGSTGGGSFYLYLPSAQVVPLDLGSGQILFLDVNDRGIVGGTIAPVGPANDRAFRFNPYSGRRTLLDPLPTEPDSWGTAINSRGDVLGYSFVAGGKERIGTWQRDEFEVSFVEGTPRFPTVSNGLLWNDHNLIVITNTSDGSSYLVTRPGVRKNVADLSDHLDAWTSIVDVNEHGDLLGVGGLALGYADHTFFLERQERRPEPTEGPGSRDGRDRPLPDERRSAASGGTQS